MGGTVRQRRNGMRIRYPLRFQLIFFISVLIFVLISAVGIAGYKFGAEILLEDSIEHAQQAMRNAVYNTERFLEVVNNECTQLLYDRRVLKTMQDTTNPSVMFSDDALYTSERLRTLILSNSRINAVAILKDKLMIHDQTDGRISDAILNHSLIITLYARQGKGQPVLFSLPENSDILCLARDVYDEQFITESSVFIICFSLASLSNELANSMKDLAEYASILDLDSTMYFANSPEWTNLSEDKYPPELKRIMEEHTWGSIFDSQENTLITYRKLESQDFALALRIPINVIYRRIAKLKFAFIIISATAIILASAMGFLFSLRITGPLRELVEKTERFKDDPKPYEIRYKKNDEIGRLATSFETMSKKINTLVNNVYKEEILRKNVELKALAAQINPHFLFNALESINMTARMNNDHEAGEMITALADILRSKMGRDNKAVVSVEKELSHVKNYLFLQKFRYDEDLTFSMHVDEALYGYQVPVLMLQGFVENAIQHNDPSSKPLNIEVSGKFEDEFLVFRITDNGRGFSRLKLAEINADIAAAMRPSGLEREKKEPGIGVANTARRLYLLFGEKSSLEITGDHGRNTMIRIAIPIESMDSYSEEKR